MEWLIDGRLPVGRAALFSGHGGEGKSRLALAMPSARAVGRATLVAQIVICGPHSVDPEAAPGEGG